MKKLMLTLAIMTVATTSSFANTNSANTAQINACVAQLSEKIADKASAQKVCSCVANEQSKVTQAQKTELENLVKSGKDIRSNKTFQNLSNRIKACGKGVKFS